jgi:hypothetical protein
MDSCVQLLVGDGPITLVSRGHFALALQQIAPNTLERGVFRQANQSTRQADGFEYAYTLFAQTAASGSSNISSHSMR